MKKTRIGFRILAILYLFLLTGLPILPAQEGAKQKIILAVQPSLSTAEIIEKAKPLEMALEKAMPDIDVEIYAPMSYAAAVEALRYGHADAALMGAWPAGLAVKLAGAEVPLAEVREVIHGTEKTEASYYYSYWITLQGSAEQKLEDLKGKDVCFASPVSTSGYVAPLGRLVELGLIVKEEGKEADPKSFFGNVLFGGGYPQCWSALQSGQVAATVIAGDVPEILYREVFAKTRVIGEQGPIPSHALVTAKEIDSAKRDRLIAALEKIAAADRALMRNFISGIFVRFQRTSAEEHLKGLRQYLEQTGLQYAERLG